MKTRTAILIASILIALADTATTALAAHRLGIKHEQNKLIKTLYTRIGDLAWPIWAPTETLAIHTATTTIQALRRRLDVQIPAEIIILAATTIPPINNTIILIK